MRDKVDDGILTRAVWGLARSRAGRGLDLWTSEFPLWLNNSPHRPWLILWQWHPDAPLALPAGFHRDSTMIV